MPSGVWPGSETVRRRTDQPLRHRKARDRAAILPLVGAILFLPPVAGVFRMEASIGGIPLIVVCIFGVWAALIAGAAVLAPRLAEADGETGTGDAPSDNAAPDGTEGGQATAVHMRSPSTRSNG